MTLKVTKFYFYLIYFIVAYGARTCPETNSKEPELIPNPRDCTKFYICDSGVAFGQNCSEGLYFNPSLNVCDHPGNVVFCEYDDFVYIKAHCDCSKYVICNYGEVEIMDCSQGYHYSDGSDLPTSYYEPCEPGNC